MQISSANPLQSRLRPLSNYYYNSCGERGKDDGLSEAVGEIPSQTPPGSSRRANNSLQGTPSQCGGTTHTGLTTQPMDFRPHMGVHQQKGSTMTAGEAIAAGRPSHRMANCRRAQGRPCTARSGSRGENQGTLGGWGTKGSMAEPKRLVQSRHQSRQK